MISAADPLPTTGLPAHSGPPWRLVLLLMALCSMAHFNRMSMAAAGVRIMPEYDIAPTTMGWVYSAFLITYTLFQIPGGWLIDRRGPRLALLVMSFGSAVFIALTGCVGLVGGSTASVVLGLFAVRASMGIVSSPLHPATARAVSLEVPLAWRSTANGLATSGALLGVASAPVVFSALVDRLGWPRAFIAAALVTALLGGLWARFGAKATLPQEALSAELHHSTPDAMVKVDRNLVLLTLSYAAVGYCQYLFFYWTQFYFESVLKLDAEQSRFYAAVPPLAMAFAMPVGGWLADRAQAIAGTRRARSALVGGSMAACAALVLAGALTTQPFWIVTWLSLALAALGLAEGPFWVTAVEVGGRRGGMSAAIFNTGGNAGGIAAPVVTPWISDALGLGWQTGIATGSVICLVGGIVWYWIELDSPGSANTGAYEDHED